MEYLAGYRIEYCPRFGAAGIEDQIEENALAQNTLWNAMRFIVVDQGQLGVELRFVSHAENRSIDVLLLIVGNTQGTVSRSVNVLERLLPEDYGWARLDIQGNPLLEPCLPSGSAWRVARLVRRTEMFDLPASFPWLHGRSAREAAGNPVPQTPAVPESTLARVTERFDCPVRRRIPMYGFPVVEQYISQPLCLPLLGQMTDGSSHRDRFCQEMQHAAPVILSIAAHPIDEDLLCEDRATATYLREWLAPFSQEMAGVGYSRIEQIRAIYDRYWLPSTHLCNLTIRIAALEDSRALGVAHSLCAQFGGMRAFEVRPPTRDLTDLAALAHPSEHDAERLEEWLNALAVIQDPAYKGFLSRMPELYTLDEAERLFRLPFGKEAGLPGIPTRLRPPFHASSVPYQPRTAAPPPHRIRIGLAQTSTLFDAHDTSDSDAAQWHTLHVDDLSKHALIVGSTGSGKTVTTLFLARELARLGLPFLVIEPVKTEYFDRLKPHIPNVARFRFEGQGDGNPASDFLPFDPMRLQPGVSVARHISYLKSCFEAAFPLTDILSLVLENGLRAYYTRPIPEGGCGLRIFQRGGRACHRIVNDTVRPSFRTFCDFFVDRYLEEVLAPPSSGKISASSLEFLYTWRQVFRRRFENLVGGPLGEAFRRADVYARRDLARFYDPFSYLLLRPTILELDAIADNEQKALVMAFLLTFLFERRQAEDMLRREGKLPPVSSGLTHVLIVEEAHRLLSRGGAGRSSQGESVGQDSRAKAVSLFVDMLAEIRALRQGMVIVEQIPTKIVPEAVKNTNLKIMLRLTSKDDRDFLGEAMNFNDEQKHFVTNLRPGQYVVFEENVDQPLLLTLPQEREWQRLPG